MLTYKIRDYSLPGFIDKDELILETLEILLTEDGGFQVCAIMDSIAPDTELPPEVLAQPFFASFDEACEFIRKQEFNQYFGKEVSLAVFGKPVNWRSKLERASDDSDYSDEEWEALPIYENEPHCLGHTKRQNNPKAFTLVTCEKPWRALNRLERRYQFFKNTVLKDYDENPEDFLAAYEFISKHPAFWTRRFGKERAGRKRYVNWHTDKGIGAINANPCRDLDSPSSGYDWVIRGGHHVEHDHPEAPAYTSHYDNYYLASMGKTYEEAFIRFAKNARRYLPIDGNTADPAFGTDLPEPPEYLKEVRRRVEEYRAEMGETGDGP